MIQLISTDLIGTTRTLISCVLLCLGISLLRCLCQEGVHLGTSDRAHIVRKRPRMNLNVDINNSCHVAGDPLSSSGPGVATFAGPSPPSKTSAARLDPGTHTHV